jgi:hypothetical protein
MELKFNTNGTIRLIYMGYELDLRDLYYEELKLNVYNQLGYKWN